jgi:dTDP-4-amino-4,6-dideoxygalactose transaminase
VWGGGASIRPVAAPASSLKPIFLSAPWIDEEEQARVRQALAGSTVGNGPFCQKVEKRLEALLGTHRVLLTTSCTHAMELALMALGIGPGQSVVCPSFTFVSTANAILRVGARVIFADIEERTLGLDPADVERRLEKDTTALLPVHYAGLAAEMDGLLEIARSRRLKVIEDAAHGLGARFRGQPLGTLGQAGCFSFHETKNITCGEGGAACFPDEESAQRAEVIREKGTNRSAFLRGQVDKYTWVAEGSSYVLSDLLAAMLDGQLEKLDRIQAGRARVTAAYRQALSPWAERHGVRLPAVDGLRQGNDHIFQLLFAGEGDRDRAMAALRAEGVMATFHYVPLHSSPHGRTLGQGGAPLPVTESVAGRLLRLPLHPLLSDADVERVIASVLRSL